MRGTAIGAALLLGLGGLAGAQERPASEATSNGGGWLSRLWPFGRKAEPAKKGDDRAESRKPSSVDEAAGLRAREEAAYQRRAAVCLRLQEIALHNRDADLEQRAEQLRQMAWDTYLLRTAHLPGSAASADEDALARRLGPGRGEELLSGGGRTGAGVATRKE